MRNSQTFIIGLGTNKGDKLSNLRQAVREIENDKDIVLISTSRIYKTNAVLLSGAPKEWDIPFFNAAIKIETTLSAEALLKCLKQIEHKIGRPKEYDRWAPRIIDLDILSCGQTTFESETLVIPHCLLLNRSFALIPLLDIEPKWRHPKYPDQNLCQLVESLESVEVLPYPLKGTQIMGVINLTPISMSGPNQPLLERELREEFVKMVNEGAEIVDIGAESTRPRAEPLSPEKEWERLQVFLGDLKAMRSDSRLLIQPKISIDTYHAETVKKLKNYAVDIINDVSGAEKECIASFLKGTNKKYVLVHNMGRAGTTYMACEDHETITHMIAWFREQINLLLRHGVEKNQIIIDPGIGFGKKGGKAAAIIKDIKRFKELGCPILLGHSRKASALPKVAHLPAVERDLETAFLSKYFSKKGVDLVRVHNCALNRRVIDEKISLIVAHQTDRGMGFKNQIPWSLKEDKKAFREATLNKTIIMGRKTFESIGRVLPSRRNVVLSKTLSPSSCKGADIYSSLQEAFSSIKPKEEVFIIGGTELFDATLEHADSLYLTLVQANKPSDTFFPEVCKEDWTLEKQRKVSQDQENEFPYVIQTFVR